ncbi:WD40 repeat domain-containing protein [Chloroflexi bacterium TSY]|nr:WD40 repeat domain-containing protein [Chloroflexi bacterium TSY]
MADTVDELFAGDIGEFLAGESLVFDDVRTVLDQQFGRLLPLEQEILLWLAVAREPMSLPEIRTNLLYAPQQRKLLEALRNLQRRSLIERHQAGFGLQNVIIEYLTDHLLETVSQEVESAELVILHQQALLMTQSKEYTRKSQIRLLLEPLIQTLNAAYPPTRLFEHLGMLVSHLRTTVPHKPSYAAGNILNLLLHMGHDVSGLDFSDLSVWQVDMQTRSLAGVDLTRADLAKCLFRQTFGRMEAVAISPDGQFVAIGDEHGEIRLCRVADGQLHMQLTGHTNIVTGLDFSRDGRLLASCAHDQTARIWSTEYNELMHTLEIQTGSQYAVAFSTDGRLLASGAGDATIYIWDVETGHCLLVLEKHTATVRSVKFVPDSRILFSVGFDGRILVWNLSIVDTLLSNDEQNVPTILGEARSIPGNRELNYIWLAISQDQSSIAAGTMEGVILELDYAEGALRQTLEGHRSEIRDLVFWPDDATLISVSEDTTIRIWDLETNRCIDVLEEHQAGIWSLACCPTNRIFVSGGDDGVVHIWEMTEQRQSILTSTIRGNVEAVEAVAWSTTNSIVATANVQGLIHIWDVSQPDVASLCEFQATGRIYAIAFSPDGQLLATGGETQNNMIHLWDLAGGESIGALIGHDDYSKALRFSPNGTMLASGTNDGQICLWDITNPMQSGLRRVIDGHDLDTTSLAFSSDGRLLVSAGSDYVVRIWNVDSGAKIYELPAAKHNNAVACHPTDAIIAYLDPDERIVIADLGHVESHQVYQRLPYHTHIIYGLVFSSDGDQLASVGMDHVVRVWDVASGEQIHSISVNQHVYSIAYSPDGHMIVTAAQDGAARIWDIATGQCLKILRPPRLYEDTNITGVTGISDAQKAALSALGAVDHELAE